MATSTAAIQSDREPKRSRVGGARDAGPDFGILAGLAIAAIALAAGVAVTGVNLGYFLQPASLLIVVGGTAGVVMITTPHPALLLALRQTLNLLSTPDRPDKEGLIEEIVSHARNVRMLGILAIEPALGGIGHAFLRDALTLALDARQRGELQSTLETKIRLCERQSEAAARVLEVAGGLTPTLGVLGTVVGLIDVLRQFSSLSAVASGVGAAFASTFYGLALANVLLLPAAHRIRARSMETFDLQEMLADGVLCLFDGMHPKLIRERLHSFLNGAGVPEIQQP